MLYKETQNSKNASKHSLGLFLAFPKVLDSQFLRYTFPDISDVALFSIWLQRWYKNVYIFYKIQESHLLFQTSHQHGSFEKEWD